MRRHNAVAGWILLMGMVGAGCAVSPASKAPQAPPASASAAPVAGFAPTDPTRVEVLPWAPSQPYHRLAEITVIPEQNTPPALIQTRLLESAAALGAHALFVVSDPSHRLRVVQVDPLLEEQHPKHPTNGVVAVAIRYQ